MGVSGCLRKNYTREIVMIDHPRKLSPAIISRHTVFQFSVSVFAKANSLYVMIMIAFKSLLGQVCSNSIELHEQKANLQTYWAAAMWLVWWWTSRTKPYLTIHNLWVFEEVLYLALLQFIDYHEQQQSRFVWVCGLQKLTQKVWTSFTSGNGQHSFAFQTKLHTWIAFMHNYTV